MSDNLVQLNDYLKRPTEPALPPADLKPPAGGGTSDGMAPWEPAIQRLEDKLESRFLWLLAAFAAGFVVLMGLVLNRTDSIADKLGTKIEVLDQRLSGRLDSIGLQLGTTNERLAKIEGAAAKPEPPTIH